MRGRVKSNKRNKYNVNFLLNVVNQCVCKSAIRFGTYTKRASHIPSPPPAENVKGEGGQQPKIRYYCYLVYIIIVVHVFVIAP